MTEELIAADEIYNVALQVLDAHKVDAMAVPLISATVAHRLDAFATGAMAREMAALKKGTDTEEVANGGHID